MKGLEALDRVKKSHFVALSMLGVKKRDIETENAIAIIEKELKALEIIRQSCDVIFSSSSTIKEEDLDLVKEVLKNE